ncbi:MAG: CAP domain-containing protein [Thermocladium sp.]
MSSNRDSGCFFDGLMDLMEFAAKYRRLGRLGFDDWQIVSEVASAVSKMLREGRERGCPNLEDMIANIAVRTLDDLGIDRYSIMRGYLQGTTEDVRRVLRRIFPNIEQITRPPPHVVHAQPGATSRSSEAPIYVVPSNYGYGGGGKGRPRRRRRDKAIAGFIIGLVLLLMVIGAAWSLRHPPQTQQTSITTSSVSAQPNSAVTYTQSTIDPTWVSQFISIVNQYRQSSGAPPLQYCQWLSNFAYVRFETMIQNPAISHYGFDQDFNKYLSQYQGFLMVGEEGLYPSGYTPSEYVQNMQSEAPLHWEGLMNGNFTYYGYYIGYGPDYVIVGSCPVTEIPGPNIDIPQYLQSYGCSVELENTTWLVIELSNWCSG